MHLIGQNKHSKFTYNTLRILPVTMACVVLCWQTYLGMYSSAFSLFEPWRRHLRRVTSAKGSQKSESYMLAFDWLEQTDKIGCNIFSLREWLVQSYGARLFGNTLLNFVSNLSLEDSNWVLYVDDNTMFPKWGILNVPFCSIFVPFHFYLIMTLVVPCLHNMFMVLLILH